MHGRTVALPVELGAYDPPPPGRAPEAGEHTEQILLELGHDWPEIGALEDAGVIP